MEVVVAAVSAAIALVALVVSMVVARRQIAIQERLAAIEEARRAEEVEARTRAWVRATVSREGRMPALVLHNEGSALARGVDIEVEWLNLDQFPRVNGREVLPVDLQPGQQMAFSIPVSMGFLLVFRVTVHWSDGAGDHAEPFSLRNP